MERQVLVSTHSPNVIDVLTGLRAVAALWVVVYHFVKAEGVGGIVDLPELFWRGRLGVDVFFVLSGFVLGYVYVSRFRAGISLVAYRDYLLLRLGRIYPLHLATLLLLLLGVLLLRSQGLEPRNAGSFGFQELLLNLLLVQAWIGDATLSWNFVSWSISAEWFAYLLILPLLARWVGPRAAWITLTLALVATIAFELFYARDPATGLHMVESQNALWRVSTEFFLGYATFLMWSIYRRPGWVADGAALLGLALLLYSSSPTAGSERYLLAPGIALLIFGLASRGAIGEWLLARRPMIYLGEISYSIYMIHPLVLIASNLLVRRAGIEPSASSGMIIFSVDCVLSVLLAAAAYRWIELPCREFVRATVQAPKKAITRGPVFK